MDPPTTEEKAGAGARNAEELSTTAENVTHNDERIEEQQHASVGQTAQSLQNTAQQLTDQALHFLSTASNETLGACLVGIGATTYFVLGRVGLVLIGVVGGVVLHATWEGSVEGPGNAVTKAVEEKRRKEVGVDVMHRVLDWRSRHKQAGQEEEEDEDSMKVDVFTKKRLDFNGFRPETEEALNELTEAVIRDYVKYERMALCAELN
jgi:hypothetical protein